jgi:hypothetical protein
MPLSNGQLTRVFGFVHSGAGLNGSARLVGFIARGSYNGSANVLTASSAAPLLKLPHR